MAYYSLKSEPKLPAHFMLIHKYPSPMNDDYIRTLLPWEGKKESELVITMVIRGTKDLADVLSDALIEPVPYRGGHAHGGILASGKSLVELYTQKLKLLFLNVLRAFWLKECQNGKHRQDRKNYGH